MNGHDELIKINFGCGTNKIEGWQNYDSEIDIACPLPFGDDSAHFMLAEHVVEHVAYDEAIGFMRECRRVLASGGVLRVIVPSVERIMLLADDNYLKFVSRWTTEPGVRGAMGAILFAHGHQTAWTEGLMRATLFYVGFDPKACEPNMSGHNELKSIDGHATVIGWNNNWIESSVFEGTKQGDDTNG